MPRASERPACGEERGSDCSERDTTTTGVVEQTRGAARIRRHGRAAAHARDIHLACWPRSCPFAVLELLTVHAGRVARSEVYLSDTATLLRVLDER